MSKIYSLDRYFKYVVDNFIDPNYEYSEHEQSMHALRCGDNETLVQLKNSSELVHYKVNYLSNCCCIGDEAIEEAIYYYTYLTLEIEEVGGYSDDAREKMLDIFLSNRGLRMY